MERTSGGSHRNVAVLAASLFGLALGEELWQAYLPAYLSTLGASGIVVGLFGSTKDLLDSLYQYPGGRLSDRLGRRWALLILTGLAMAGYASYRLAPSWPMVFAGLFGVMAWKAGAFPTTFAVIGDSLPRERRAMAFSVQSILVRVPRVIGAPLGGIAITSLGTVDGVRAMLLVTLALGLVVMVVQYIGFRDGRSPQSHTTNTSARALWIAMPRDLRMLLAVDCLVRIGEGIAASFIVLYVIQARGFSAADFGVLYGIQHLVAIASYLPGARIAGVTGRPPVVALTFAFFALFPLAVRLASGYQALAAAFVVGGLKEIGEPARKSMILDFAPDDSRGATVGVYYTIRNLIVVPAGVIGGLLWQRSPALPLEVAFAVSAAGLIVFVVGSGRES
jgi:predicted MFS family arabinose efflux permease